MDLNKADRTLRNLKPRAAAYTVALGDGICCRIAPNGLRTLELRARLHGTVTRFALGSYPAITVTEAHAKAAGYRAMLKDGLSPKVAAQRATNGDLPRNVKEAAARFIEGHLKVKAGGTWAAEAGRLIKVEVLPALGDHPLQQLQRTDLTALIERKARDLRARNKRGVAANRLAAVLGKMFSWCAAQGWVSAELATKLPKPASEKAKDRTLSADDANNELGEIWRVLDNHATNGTGMPAPHGRILQLLALTGARCSEVTGLTTACYNPKTCSLVIVEGKTAASRRTIPTPPAARFIIEEAIAKVGQGLLFPSARARTAIPSNEISRSCRKLVKLAGVPPFTPHDLRRTAISIMAEAGVDGDIRRRVTGHQAQDVHGKIYDRAQRLEDMRAALLIVERHYAEAGARAVVKAPAACENVVTLRRAK